MFSVFIKKTFTKRRSLALGVLLVGIIASLAIANNSPKEQKGLTVASATSTDPQLDFTVAPLPNLTNEFTDQALSKLVSQNQLNAKDIQTLPNTADVEKIVNDIIDGEVAKETPDPSKVRRSTDDSKEMQIAYLMAISDIVQRSAIDTTTIDQGSELNTFFTLVGTRFQTTTDVLESMNVPPSWADIHAKLIAFYTAQADIYRSLGSGSNDPLRFIIALQRAPTQTENAFGVIKNEIDQRIKDQKLG